jgi:PAS domain S-box-containing protein
LGPDSLLLALPRGGVAAAMAPRLKLPLATWSVIYRLHSRDGREHWVQEAAKVLQEGCDHVVVGTLTDITELRALEEQAQQLTAILESLAETSLLAMAGLDGDLKVVMANARFCALVGFSPQAIVGLPGSALAAGPLATQADGQAWPGENLEATLKSVLEGSDALQRRLLALRSQDGRFHPVEMEILPVAHHAGGVRVLLLVQEGPTASS